MTDSIFKCDDKQNGSINSAELFLNKSQFRIINSEGIDLSFNNYKGYLEFITNWKDDSEEIELYKDLFGAKVIDHMPFSKEMGGDSFGFPDDYDYENSTMHAVLDIGGNTVMLSDNPMGKSESGNVQVLITVDSKEEIDEINEKVQKKKITIIMPY